MSFTVVYFLSFVIVAATGCKPINAFWMQHSIEWLATNREYTCRNDRFPVIFSGVLSILGDAYSLVIPALILLKLNLPKRQVLGMYLVFGLGVS